MGARGERQGVDLEAATVHMVGTVQRIKSGGLTFSELKTAGSRRQIALTAMALSALKGHRARQAEERLKAGPEWTDNGLVFCNSLGKPLEPINVLKYSFKPLLKKAGLPSIRFHDLRHTAATILLRKRVPAKIVSEMLGHAQVGITLNIYSHVLPDMQKDATLAMESALLGGDIGIKTGISR